MESGLETLIMLIGGGITFKYQACPKQMTVTFTVTNKGSAKVGPGLKCTLYYNNPQAGGTKLKTVQTTKALLPNGTETITTTVTLPASYKGEKFDMYIRVDDRGDRKGQRNEGTESSNTSSGRTQCKAPRKTPPQ